VTRSAAQATGFNRYFDPLALASVSSLELRARMVVEGVMSGMHRSPYHGFSIEFAQHRPYTPGDDLRHLDWKVFARTDRFQLKQYEQETNLDLVVVVDVSGSMAYASDRKLGWRKFDHAATLAAALAFLAVRQQDRVGVVLFADGLRDQTRLANSREHWRTIVESLAGAELIDEQGPMPGESDAVEAARTRTGRLFDQVLARLTQRSLIVLLSDLFDEPESLETAMARVNHRRHDMLVMQVVDPAEEDFPFRDPGDFVGMEGEGRLKLDPPAIRRAYLEAWEAHNARLEEAARKFKFDFTRLRSDQPLSAPVRQFLARRSAMIGRGRK
jgi:uncharacterized protein (DUF58 family)